MVLLSLTLDEIWGEDKVVHLSGLPVTNMGDDPLSPTCGIVGSTCLLGLYPGTIRHLILKTPLVWCMNGDVVCSVGSAPYKSSIYNEMMGWLGFSEPKETEYHREILSSAFSDEETDTNIYDLLPMALPLPFNHGLPMNIFAGAGENSHQ
jgi:hypothetical protein